MTAPSLSGKKRSFPRGMALTLVTFGIYALYWHYKAYKEVYDQEGRTDFPTAAWILLLIPLANVLGILWLSIAGIDLVNHGRRHRGLPDGVSLGEFLTWIFVGMLIVVGPFIAYYRLQTSINEYWDAVATPRPAQHAPAASGATGP